MTLVARLRGRIYARRIRELAAGYSNVALADRESIQLELLNREWGRISASIPYFQRLRSTRGLPGGFRAIEEFCARVPIAPREEIQDHGAAMRSPERPPDLTRMTGGSTAKPVRIPAWKSELEHQRWDTWCARGWYGIQPSDRLFLVWGHSHLLGSGARGWINARRLELSDLLLGYRRFSAYDLRPEAMVRAADSLLLFRPRYVLGYSVALDLFAQANADRADELRQSGVRLVVGTAESFPSAESVARLQDLFGCEVAMEYGAVETGLMAHTHPSGGYRVFWRSYLLETAAGAGSNRVLVTSLYPRSLPLLRYEIGDEIEIGDAVDSGNAGLHAFQRVIGRCNDYLVLSDGTTVHSEVFSHVARACPAIRGFQVVEQPGRLVFRYTSAAALSGGEEAEMRERFSKIHGELRCIGLEKVDVLDQTVAGKTHMVIREAEPSRPPLASASGS
jgi:phenylacetate-coenzyme A ligase PaaK-like adenylate-forming protein